MRSIEIITIPVTDQVKAKEFYLKLGFQVIIEAPLGNGQTWLQLGFPGVTTAISLASWFPYKEVAMKPGTLQGIIFETDDIEKEVRGLKESGIEFGVISSEGFKAGKIDDTPWGKFTHFTDPDGNGLTFHQK